MGLKISLAFSRFRLSTKDMYSAYANSTALSNYSII